MHVRGTRAAPAPPMHVRGTRAAAPTCMQSCMPVQEVQLDNVTPTRGPLLPPRPPSPSGGAAGQRDPPAHALE